MKFFLLFLLSCVTFSIHAQYLTAGLVADVPLGIQQDRLKNAYGVTMGFEQHFKKSPLYFVLDGAWSVFDMKTIKENVEGPSGYATEQKINYTSSIFNLTPGLGIAPWHNKKVSPYMAVKGGYMKYKTRMTLYDPEDENGCHPLDAENILRDMTAVAVANGGVSFKVPTKCKPIYLDFGTNYITGGRAQYLRMRKDISQPAPVAESELYLVKFQQVQTGDVHEHALGRVYHTKTEQLQFYVRVKIPFW